MLIPPDKETGSERVGSLPTVTQQSWDSNQTLKLSPMRLASCWGWGPPVCHGPNPS